MSIWEIKKQDLRLDSWFERAASFKDITQKQRQNCRILIYFIFTLYIIRAIIKNRKALFCQYPAVNSQRNQILLANEINQFMFISHSLSLDKKQFYLIINKSQSNMKRSRLEQEKREREIKGSQVLCKHCGKLIIIENYLIHEPRCEMMRSRAYLPEELEKQEISQFPSSNSRYRKKQSKKEEVGPANQERGSNRERSRIFQKRESQREEEDKIPCHFCGSMQTLAELDTHPLKCQHREQQCSLCGNKFPKSLMSEHHHICRSIHHRPQEQNSRSERDLRWMQWMEDEPEEQNYNPFGNLSSLFMAPRRPQNIHQNGTSIIGNDGRGHFIRHLIMFQPQRPSRGNRQSGYQDRFISLTNFFASLARMAGAHGNQNQGMTKDEIKNLKRLKYQGNNTSKKEGEKDICTICYCEFEKDEKLVELKCKHTYHEECITKWVQKTAKCPICKAPQTHRPVFEEEEEEYM